MTSCKPVSHVLFPEEGKPEVLCFVEGEGVRQVEVVVIPEGVDEQVFGG